MLEQAVRPFQGAPVQPPRAVIAFRTDTGAADASLTWGNAGTLASGAQQTGVGFAISCCQTEWTQGASTTEDIRAENPTDSTQYIILRRFKNITFNKKAAQCDTGKGDNLMQPFSFVDGVGNAIIATEAGFAAKLTAQSCKESFTMSYT